MTKHPIQPLELDERGTLRFKENKIVRYLLDNGGIDLNKLACLEFSREDREQFAQLIGYSLGLSDNVTYFSEQLIGADVSVYHYRVIFKPQTILPDVDFKGSTEALKDAVVPK